MPVIALPQQTNLVAWFDFSDIRTLFQDSLLTTPVTSDGDPIGGVRNKIGGISSKNIGQTDNNRRPTYKAAFKNSRSVAQFSGTLTNPPQTSTDSDWLETVSGGPATPTFVQPNTLFIVAQSTDPDGLAATNDGTYYCDAATDSGSGRERHMLFIDGDFGGGPRIVQSASTDNPTGNLDTTVWHYLSAVYNTTSSELYYNGTLEASGNAGSDDYEDLRLGGASNVLIPAALLTVNTFLGYIAEYRVYNELLSTARRQEIEAELAAKWSI